MKRIIALPLFVVFLASGFYSCKKCVTCSYTRANGDVISSGKMCGKKKDIEAEEEIWRIAAEADSTTVSCVK